MQDLSNIEIEQISGGLYDPEGNIPSPILDPRYYNTHPYLLNSAPAACPCPGRLT